MRSTFISLKVACASAASTLRYSRLPKQYCRMALSRRSCLACFHSRCCGESYCERSRQVRSLEHFPVFFRSAPLKAIAQERTPLGKTKVAVGFLPITRRAMPSYTPSRRSAFSVLASYPPTFDHALNHRLGHKCGACIIEVDSICCAGCVSSQAVPWVRWAEASIARTNQKSASDPAQPRRIASQ